MKLRELAIKKLEERGVTVHDIALIAMSIQEKYQNITCEQCEKMVDYILDKRETIYAVLTGIAIDEGAEKGLFNEEINKLINDDAGLYGLDEILALSIVNMNGSIALTKFGYLDKLNLGSLERLIKKEKKAINAILSVDDIIMRYSSFSS